MKEIQTGTRIGQRCKIKQYSAYSGRYAGQTGTIARYSTGSIGVMLDNVGPNKASLYGIYWFKCNELEAIEDTDEGLTPEEIQRREACKLQEAVYNPPINQMSCDSWTAPMQLAESKATVCVAESEEIMKLVARARNEELAALKKSETERYMALLTSDPVVVAANAKRLEMSGAEVIIPLPQVSMKTICSPETEKLLDKLQHEYTQRAEKIQRRYDELLEALEIPGVNVIETLQAAGVLNYDNTGLDKLPEVEPWSV